jgi:hypothetical protein
MMLVANATPKAAISNNAFIWWGLKRGHGEETSFFVPLL